jgi:hypothetical protein
MKLLPNTHRCPGPGCSVVVPNSKFACYIHWFSLKPATRTLIYRTAALPSLHPERRVAFEAARSDWREETAPSA